MEKGTRHWASGFVFNYAGTSQALGKKKQTFKQKKIQQ